MIFIAFVGRFDGFEDLKKRKNGRIKMINNANDMDR